SNEPTQLAELEAILDLLTLVDRDATVMRAHQDFASELIYGTGDALGKPTIVYKDQRRTVGTDQFQEFRMDRGPDGDAPWRLRSRTAGQRIDLIKARHILDGDRYA